MSEISLFELNCGNRKYVVYLIKIYSARAKIIRFFLLKFVQKFIFITINNMTSAAQVKS